MAERAERSGPRPKLLDEVRQAIRARQFSRRTEEAYVGWVKRYVLHHGRQHPERLGEAAVTEFLTHLAATQRVSAATQNQAASALLFLYREVLGLPMDPPKGVIRPVRPCSNCVQVGAWRRVAEDIRTSQDCGVCKLVVARLRHSQR